MKNILLSDEKTSLWFIVTNGLVYLQVNIGRAGTRNERVVSRGSSQYIIKREHVIRLWRFWVIDQIPVHSKQPYLLSLNYIDCE